MLYVVTVSYDHKLVNLKQYFICGLQINKNQQQFEATSFIPLHLQLFVYEGRQSTSFVCHIEIPKPWHPFCALGMVGMLSMSRGESRWFGNVQTYNPRVIEYGTNLSKTLSKSKLNVLENLGQTLGICISFVGGNFYHFENCIFK